MIRQQFTRVGLGLPALVVVALLAGCGLFNPDPHHDPVDPVITGNRETPANLVAFFAEVQSTPIKDITEYENSLHPGYQFYFLTADLPPGSTEDYWTREEDVNAMQDLFNAAISITAHMTLVDSVAAEPCDPGTPEVICVQYNVLVDLIVVAPHPETHEVTSFLVNGDADFVITKDPADSTLYVIREIHDRTGQPARAAPRSGESASLTELGSRQVSLGELREILREDAALAQGRRGVVSQGR